MAPRLSEENWKYSFKLFCFQAPQKPFLERGGIVRDKLMHLFHCLRLMSDFCALWSTIASCRWLLPQSFVCPQNLCGWMSVCHWLCVDDGAACEELHCAQENVEGSAFNPCCLCWCSKQFSYPHSYREFWEGTDISLCPVADFSAPCPMQKGCCSCPQVN